MKLNATFSNSLSLDATLQESHLFSAEYGNVVYHVGDSGIYSPEIKTIRCIDSATYDSFPDSIKNDPTKLFFLMG